MLIGCQLWVVCDTGSGPSWGCPPCPSLPSCPAPSQQRAAFLSLPASRGFICGARLVSCSAHLCLPNARQTVPPCPPRYFICDAKLAALGWQETTDWADGLRSTVDWYLSNGFSDYWDSGERFREHSAVQ